MHKLYMKTIKVPVRYVPRTISDKDRRKQTKMLNKSRKMYKKGSYYIRDKLPTFTSKISKHIVNARNIYDINDVTPNKTLSRKTGCSVNALRKIVKRGMGAYYSSGSRPNQTAHSWGLARLASSITGGKSAAVDYAILDKGCNHKQKAFLLANKSVKKYKHGQSHTKRIVIHA